MNLNENFLRNELIWLDSIGCEIFESEFYIIVKNEVIKTEDFNFIFLKKMMEEEQLISLMQSHKLRFLRTIDDVTASYLRFYRMPTSDINYVAFYNEEALERLQKQGNDLYLSLEKKWTAIFPKERIFSKTIIPYTLCLGDLVIGKVCLVFSDENIGIYDFEVYPSFRKKGYAKLFFSLLLSKGKNMKKGEIYIQSWRENIPANNLYLSEGFKFMSNYYYFVLRSS